MTLRASIKTNLSTLPLFQSGSQLLEASEGGQSVRCELVALDSLACAFTSLTLTSGALAGLASAELQKVAATLSERVNYLLEPISPIETDSEGCTVQMRSMPPQKEDGRTSYYELLVSRTGGINLTRYERTGHADRQVIAAEVTREVLLRLVGDFSAVA
jgi:hypothetical protein